MRLPPRASHLPSPFVPSMTASDGVHTPWWGSASLALDQAARWNVGPCTLWLHRTDREWRLAARHADEANASPASEPGSSTSSAADL